MFDLGCPFLAAGSFIFRLRPIKNTDFYSMHGFALSQQTAERFLHGVVQEAVVAESLL